MLSTCKCQLCSEGEKLVCSPSIVFWGHQETHWGCTESDVTEVT